MEQNSFIKLWRSMIEWEWYNDINTCRLFIHLLLTVNYKDKMWRGVLVERGSRIISYSKLAEEIGLSVQAIRTSINRLKSTCEITYQSTSNYSVISVVNYNKYQTFVPEDNTLDNTQLNNQPTSEQQASNKQVTTTKESNKERKKELKNKKIYGEFQNVKLTDEEFQKLEEENLLDMIDRLSGYIASKGDKYKSHYATIKQWVARDQKEGKREITSRSATNTSGTGPDGKYTVGPDGIRRDKYGLEIL